MRSLGLAISGLSFLTLLCLFLPNRVLADSALVTKIVFATTTPQTIGANTASAVLTTQTRNGANTLEQVSAATVLEYSSSSPTGQFSNANSSSCSGTFSNQPFTLTMSTGSANKNFCYRDSTPGTHTLTVMAEGQSWTAATQTIVISAPPDATAPVITLVGSATTTLTVGDAYVEAGATALDDTDGDISASVVIDASAVNMNAAGTYTVTYAVSDSAGNVASAVTRAVVVSASPPAPDTAPDPFVFSPQTDVALGAEIVSDAVTVGGVDTPTSISVSGGEYAVNGGTYTADAGTVVLGDSVTVRHTASVDGGATVTTALVVGGVSSVFTSTTPTGSVGNGGSAPRRSRAGAPIEVVRDAETVTSAELTSEDNSGAMRIEREVRAHYAHVLDLMHEWVMALRAELRAP